VYQGPGSFLVGEMMSRFTIQAERVLQMRISASRGTECCRPTSITPWVVAITGVSNLWEEDNIAVFWRLRLDISNSMRAVGFDHVQEQQRKIQLPVCAPDVVHCGLAAVEGHVRPRKVVGDVIITSYSTLEMATRATNCQDGEGRPRGPATSMQ